MKKYKTGTSMPDNEYSQMLNWTFFIIKIPIETMMLR